MFKCVLLGLLEWADEKDLAAIKAARVALAIHPATLFAFNCADFFLFVVECSVKRFL